MFCDKLEFRFIRVDNVPHDRYSTLLTPTAVWGFFVLGKDIVFLVYL